ncbi:restriction endonuclease subunit S [Vibrio campbellii]|uniref:restriction endonuclease subunit S n=1 Tax=Vibrio campbellii TaxID=680 RepID=UPI001F36FE82|nr:restriction endonuclease subunit S [Vibrio campbellii]MCE7728505.1 restriction endonuclease subunit S [Vibrio campbellii]
MSQIEQQIPHGYKKTEIGVIPEDWDASRMGDLAKIQRGASPRPIDNPIWFDRNSEIGWLRISDVTKTSKYLTETTQSLSQLGVDNSRYVASGNLVMSICATVGKPIITRRHLCIHDGFVVFNNLQVEQNYMYYILKDLEDEWGKQGQTGSQMNLNTDLINSTFISVPQNKNEQTAIANALSDVDALLAELEKLIAKKQAIKTATMQQLLTGKTRLPQFATYSEGEKLGQPKGTKSSELGEIPEDWNYRPITEIVMRGTASIKIGPFGSALKKEYLVKSGYKVYGQENVYEKNMEVGDRYISHDHYVQLKSCKIEQGDFLISMMGTIGKCFIAPPDTEEGIMDSHLLRLRLDSKKLEARLLIQLFQTPIILDQISKLSVGGIMDGLSSKIIKSLYLPLPDDITEQKQIANILSDMDNEIQTLEQRLAKTRQIKQGMMQEMLTGRTRLPFEKES